MRRRRPSGQRAAVAANVALALLAFFMLYALGGYAMEHEAKESTALEIVDVTMTAALIVAVVATWLTVTGRPRRLAARRQQVGILGAAVAWPLTCVLLAVAAVLAY